MKKIIKKVADKTIASGGWLRRHPKISLAGLVVLLGLISGGIWLLTHQPVAEKISTNPVVASYQKQLPALAEAVKKNGNDAQARYNYAVALYATGDVAKAKEQYEAQSRINPSDATLANNLGNVYRDLNDYQKAIDSYQKAIRLDPKAVNSYINLANIYLYSLNKKDLAVKTYQDALGNLPNNQELEVLLGIAYEQSGDKTNAAATFQEVLSQNSNNAAAKAGLSRVQ